MTTDSYNRKDSNPKQRNKEIKEDILRNMINTPERLNTLISILVIRDILNGADIDKIYGDDI